MGKRELLIVTAFVVIGVVAYQLGAEPPAEGRRQFSLATLMDHFREETLTLTHAADSNLPKFEKCSSR